MLVFKNLCQHFSSEYGGLVVNFHGHRLCEVYFVYLNPKENQHLWEYCARFGNNPEHYLSGMVHDLYRIIQNAHTQEQLYWAEDNKKNYKII